MKQISFIHAADLHLDSPMVGLKQLPSTILSRLRDSTFSALQKLTNEAISRQVDFVILAGDLYEGEDRSLKAQSRFRTEMLKLEQKGIHVFVIHGNHDHLNGSWVHLDMPLNVHFFDSRVEMKVFENSRGDRVHLYGFSYPKRHVFERKIDEYRKVDPADFHIGILHGNEGGRTDHDNFAPFTVKDLQGKDFDYWALGHIHKRSILSENPPIIYPGNLQGRNKKEQGIKGCYYVTLNEMGAEREFIETSDVVWEEVYVDASSSNSFQEIFQLCQEAINKVRKEEIGTLITLYLENVQLENQRESKILDSELLEVLLEHESGEVSFVWIVDLIISENQQYDREHLKSEAGFYAELFETVDNYLEIEEAAVSLYEHHPLGRKYLSNLTDKEKRELIEKAERLLISLLY